MHQTLINVAEAAKPTVPTTRLNIIGPGEIQFNANHHLRGCDFSTHARSEIKTSSGGVDENHDDHDDIEDRARSRMVPGRQRQTHLFSKIHIMLLHKRLRKKLFDNIIYNLTLLLYIYNIYIYIWKYIYIYI